MAEAAQAAFDLLGGEEYLAAFRRAHGWFHGRNSLNRPLVDVRSGACCDGLQACGVNRNQGAESTLAYLWTEMSTRSPAIARRQPAAAVASSNHGNHAASRIENFRSTSGLFHRYGDKPIFTAGDWPYPAHTVFNAGACQMGDETILLVRVEDRRGHSHLTVARAGRRVELADRLPTQFRSEPGQQPGRTVGWKILA